MCLRVHIVLLAVTVLQCFEAKPAVVDWYLKKKDAEAKPDKINQNARAFRSKQKANTHDHEKEFAKTVAEVTGTDTPKRKYGSSKSYTPAPTLAKPAKKEVTEAKASKKAVIAKTQNPQKFEVKPVAQKQPATKQQPVTTGAAHEITSLHNTAHSNTGSKSKSGSKDKAHQAHESHKKAHAGPAPGPGLGPAPAPAPAPLNYEQKVSKLKGDMMAKIKGDSFDADFVIERPNKVKPGTSTGQEVPVPDFKDVGGDFGPYAPAAAPLKHDDISFKTGSLPVDAAHVDRQTMTSDWHMEYGPNGPKGIHGARPWYRPWPAHGTQFQPLQIGGF